MDHRVDGEREEALLRAPEYSVDPIGEEWCHQRYNYFERAIRRPTYPGPWGPCSAYLDPPNRANAVDQRTVPGHEQLIHVASLNRILRRLASGEYETGEARLRFLELTGHTLPTRPPGAGVDPALWKQQVDEIVEETTKRGPATVCELASVLCDSLGQLQPPWWACFAAEAAPLLVTGDATSLCQSLGLGYLEAGEWLVVWRYEVRLLGYLYPGVPLFRPTVVEANDSPYHYPPPPSYRYGVTMPVSSANRGAFREVLHPPLFGSAAGDSCTGSLLQVATVPLADHNELPRLRAAHRKRLLTEYGGSETRGWLARHTHLP